MGRGQKNISLFHILFLYLLLSSMRSATEARPLSSSRSRSFFYKAASNSGPSEGGGHSSKNLQSLGRIPENSAPSSDVGHN
ncbi:hypothetical protein I3842_06G170200 [Carya illinoinensis]|uniref:Uncharacterized protein n=1 Tax=Carya illinoinensis TaxID=32201 RepID=A0A922EYC3_CARIL|nr:hypothetical protein I3842_06G170200 [Carya illinoinensis]